MHVLVIIWLVIKKGYHGKTSLSLSKLFLDFSISKLTSTLTNLKIYNAGNKLKGYSPEKNAM